MNFYITGNRRGLGYALEQRYGNCNSLEACDIFINCKHDGFSQVDMLYKAIKLDKNKRVISIGSYSSDWIYHPNVKLYQYGIEKRALRDANSSLFDHGYSVTCINYGLLDTESQADKDKPKMSVNYAVDILDWILSQKHRVKEITVAPEQ